MSSTDKRIVKLQFDNAQFEAGVSKSMSTLDKLKQKLDFSESEDSVNKLQSSLNKVDFSAMENSLKFLENRFSATGEFIYKIWDKITDKALSSFKQLESATIGQIKSGGWTRAMNLANAQFQVEGLNYSWEKIFAAADYGVTDTAYGLDSAAKAASQLAASGVNFEKTIEKVNGTEITQMHKALRGISGLAAMTNSSFDDISQIFTRIAGSGRVFATDLNSIAARGINATATLAKALKKSEADIKEMVRKGQIDFKTFADAMDNAYGEHAKEANATLQGSLSNMKAALSRIGAIFAQPVVNKTNAFFNAITAKIKTVQKSLQDVTGTIDKTTKKGKKKIQETITLQTGFATHFSQTYEKAIEVAVKLVNAIDMDWFHDVADKMDRSVMKIKNILDFVDERLTKHTKTTEKAEKDEKKSLENMVATREEYEAAMTILFKDRSLSGKKRVKWLEAQGLDPKRVQKYIDSVVAAKYVVKNASIKVEQSVNKVAGAASSVDDEMKKLPITIDEFNSMQAAGQDAFLKKYPRLAEAYRDTDNWIKKINQKQEDATNTARAYAEVSKEYARLTGHNVDNPIIDFATLTPEAREAIYKAYPKLMDTFHEAYNAPKTYASVGGIFKNLGEAASNIATNFKIVWGVIKKAFGEVFSFQGFLKGTDSLTGKFANLTKSLILTEKGTSVLHKIFVSFFKVVKFGISGIAKLAGKIFDLVAGLFTADDAIKETNKDVQKSEGFFKSLLKIIKKIGAGLGNYILNFGELIKKIGNTDGVKRLKDALSKLFNTTKKGVNDTVEPARSAFAKFADSFRMPTIDEVADAIGWIADKIAILIEQIPIWADKVAGFFTFIVDKVKEFIGDIEVADIGGNIKKGIIDAFTIDDEEEKSITNFFTNIKDSIYKFFTETDWGKVGELGKFGLVMMTFIELVRMFNNAGSLLSNVSRMFSGIGGIFKSIKKAIMGFTVGFEIASIGHLFAGIGIMIFSITTLLFAISKLSEDKIDDAMTIIVLIGGVAIAITAIMARMVKNKAVAQGNVTNGILNGLKLQIGVIGELALFLIGVGVMLKFMIASMKELGSMDTEDIIKGFGWTVGIIAFILLSAAAIVKLLQERGKQVKLMQSAGGIFAGLGVFFVLVGVSVKIIAEAMKKMDGVSGDAFVAAISILGVMLFGFGFMIRSISKLKPGEAWAAAGIMFTFGIALTAILVKLAAVAALSKTFGWGHVAVGIAAIAGIIGALSLFILAIGKAVKSVGKTGNRQLIFTILAMGAMVYLIGEALSSVFESLSNETNRGKWTSMWTTLIPIIAIMTAMIVMLGLMVHMLNTSLDKSKASKGRGKVTADDILEVAASFLIMSVAVAIIAKSISMLSGISLNGKALAVLGVILAIFTGLGLLAGYKGQFAAGILAVGTAFLLLGAGLALFGVSLLLAGKGLPPFAEGLGRLFEVIEQHKAVAIVVLIAFIAAMVALAFALKKVSDVVVVIAKPIGSLIGLIGKMANNVAGMMKSVLKELGNGGKKLITWFKKLSPVMKATIVTLVGTLLATAVHLAPKVIDTIVTILFIIVDKIMQYADVIALKLVLLLLRIITALANAINQSANAIVNAMLTVAKALLKLSVVALGKVVKALLNALGNILNRLLPGAGSWFKKLGNTFGDAMQEVADDMTSGIDEAIKDTNKDIKDLDTSVKNTTTSLGLQKDEADKLAQELGMVEKKTNDANAAQQDYNDTLAKSQTHSVEWYRVYSEEHGTKEWFQEEQNSITKYIKLMEEREAYEESLRNPKNKKKALSESEISTKLYAWDLAHATETAKQDMEEFQKNFEIFNKQGQARYRTLQAVAETYKGLFGEELDISIYGTKAWDELLKQQPEIQNMINHAIAGNLVDYEKFKVAAQEAVKNADEAEYNLETALNGALRRLGSMDLSDKEIDSALDELKEKLENAPKRISGLATQYLSNPEYYKLRFREGLISEELNAQVEELIKSVSNSWALGIANLTAEQEALFKIYSESKLDSLEKIDAYNAFYRIPEQYRSALVEAILSPESFKVDPSVPNELKKKIQDLVSQMLTMSEAYTSETFSESDYGFKNAFNPLIDEYINSWLDYDNSLVNTADNRYSKLGNSIAKQMADKVGGKLPDGIVKGMSDNEDEIPDYIDKNYDRLMIQPWRKDLGINSPSKVMADEIGENIPKGILLGMKSEEFGILEYIRENAYKLLVQPWKDELGIHSPSKVMESIGGFTVDGLISGIKDKASSLTDTAGTVISGLVSQFTDGGTDISSAFTTSLTDGSGDMFKALVGDYQTGLDIQPVLDTSSLMGGANSINSMLSDQTLTVSGFSGKLSADIASLDSQNNRGVNEIRQLREEMAMMTESLENMQIVLDSGMLVGGIANKMDYRLGSRAIYARRGG